MQMVIDIPKYVYEDIKEVYEHNHTVEATYSYIYHGTPLPKGHGDLKDACELLKHSYRIDDSATLSTRDVVNVEAIDDAPTIIEADVPDTNVGKKAGEEV